MSNKSQLQQNNTDLQEIKTAIGNLPTQAEVEAEASEGLYVWKKLTAEGGTLVGYVVDDSASAYPDGGTQDGYWYERYISTEVPIVYSYTGSSQITYEVENDYISFTLKLLSSGNLTLSKLNTPYTDVYIIGGGGGGGGAYGNYYGGGGGAGGYLQKIENAIIEKNTAHRIIIGAGGSGGAMGSSSSDNHKGTDGGTSSAFGTSATGGGAGNYSIGGNGGSGGGAGTYHNNVGTAGKGDGLSKMVVNTLYCGGGAGGGYLTGGGNGGSNGSDGYTTPHEGKGGEGGGGNFNSQGTANTGGGGSGGGASGDNGYSGGSGIVIIKGRYA